MHPLFRPTTRVLFPRAPWLLVICIVFLSAQPARAGLKFSQVIVFGDSLSDTGNFADTTQNDYGFRYPGNVFNYADGRFTDDANTSPAAAKYQGVWLEQLARLYLGLAPATASLEGGTDYAFGDAETLDGERTVAIGSNASIQIDNMGQQVTNYLNAHATDPAALYIVWGGANDLFADNSAANVTATAQRETALVRRLAEAGARTILVPNLPPLGQTPAYSGNASQAAALDQASASFRDQLAADLQALTTTLAGENLTITIYPLDLYALFNNLGASGAAVSYGFTNVTSSAQGGNVVADNYLFWDGIHPTTAGHYQIAAQAYTLLSDVPVAALTVTLGSSAGSTQAQVTLRGIAGRTYRLQSSDDLTIWTARTTLTPDATTGKATFTDPAPLPARRFYRVMQP